jgi:2-iminobutanoate/2-iminopropanoate deaminase
MKRNIISTKNAPQAIGPYSQAVKIGDLIFTSGQLSIDPDKNEFINGTVEIQTELALKNVSAVLKEAGSSLKSVVKTTVFLKNMNDFPLMNSVYAKFFPSGPPARSTVEVSALPKGALVEIEAVAIREEA